MIESLVFFIHFMHFFRCLFAMHFMMCNYRCCKAVLTLGALIINILDKHLRYHNAYYLEREYESMVSNMLKKTLCLVVRGILKIQCNPNWSYGLIPYTFEWISGSLCEFSNIPIHKTRWTEIAFENWNEQFMGFL